jgi:UDP-GlcNAc:undecaprenyl-phosphate GlcNAc-1-phosphate transferase
MSPLALLFGASFAMSLLANRLGGWLGPRVGLVDCPDGRRKMHREPIPVVGGLSIFVSLCLTIVLAMWLLEPVAVHFEEDSIVLIGLLLACAVLCAVGVADDYGKLRGRHKLLGQVLAAGVVVAFGLQVQHIHLFGVEVDLGLLAVPFTIFWLLGAINSLNLLDGMDGFLGSVGVIITLAMAAMGVMGERWTAAYLAIMLVGALLGFLRYNLPPASIFLGDAGSMLIGMIVGVLAIQSSLKAPATVALAAPLAIMTIPLLDTTAAILRRKLTGRSLYSTDRGHLHHCLLRRGYSNSRVLVWVSLLCMLTVLGALGSLMWHNEFLAIFAMLAVVAILVVSRLFGYSELTLVRKRVGQIVLSFLQTPTPHQARQMEVHLQGSASWSDLWNSLTLSARELHLVSMRLDVNAPLLHESYHANWTGSTAEGEEMSLWRAEIPLELSGQTIGRLNIVGRRDAVVIWRKVAALAEIVERFEAQAADWLTAKAHVPHLNGTHASRVSSS